MAFEASQSSIYLDSKTVIGVEEVWTHQEQDQVGRVEAFTDFVFPVRSRLNLSVMPLGDFVLLAQRSKIGAEIVA